MHPDRRPHRSFLRRSGTPHALFMAALIGLAMPLSGLDARSTARSQELAAPQANQPNRGLKTVPLTITSGKRVHRFLVEVAQTPAQQQRGLMYRTQVAPDRGMIFPMDPPRRASFWMANVPIPLDILYIRADGTIARIALAQPFSLAPIDAGERVSLVLELAGGRAAQLGLKTGDRVRWKNR